jgi:hypothetical protein
MIRPRIVTLSQTYEKSSHATVCATASAESRSIADADPPADAVVTGAAPSQVGSLGVSPTNPKRTCSSPERSVARYRVRWWIMS